MAAYAQSSAPPVSASASKGGKSKGGDGTLRSVSIDIVENGFIGRCSYEGKRDKQGFSMYSPDKQYALGDRSAVDKFLDDKLGLPKSSKK